MIQLVGLKIPVRIIIVMLLPMIGQPLQAQTFIVNDSPFIKAGIIFFGEITTVKNGTPLSGQKIFTWIQRQEALFLSKKEADDSQKVCD